MVMTVEKEKRKTKVFISHILNFSINFINSQKPSINYFRQIIKDNKLIIKFIRLLVAKPDHPSEQ